MNENTKITGILYRLLYKYWRVLPGSLRAGINRSSLLRCIKNVIRNLSASIAGRDDIYNEDYYNLVDDMAQKSMRTIATAIMEDFNPKSCLDVGCGTGVLMQVLVSKGVDAFGLEYSESALDFCKNRGLDVDKFDLTAGRYESNTEYDLCVSTEVAEHIHEEFADRLIELITNASKQVLFTAATPGQGGGVDHVNEQPHGYWIEKFELKGFIYDRELSDGYRESWMKDGVEACYYRNVMVFRCIK